MIASCCDLSPKMDPPNPKVASPSGIICEIYVYALKYTRYLYLSINDSNLLSHDKHICVVYVF